MAVSAYGMTSALTLAHCIAVGMIAALVAE
jgi:hypothetical protein